MTSLSDRSFTRARDYFDGVRNGRCAESIQDDVGAQGSVAQWKKSRA